MACSCPSRAKGCLWFVRVHATLHPPLTLGCCRAQRGRCFVPLLFPGDAEGEAELLPAARALCCLEKYSRDRVCVCVTHFLYKKRWICITWFYTSCFNYGSLDHSFDLLFSFWVVREHWTPDVTPLVVCLKWYKSLSSCLGAKGRGEGGTTIKSSACAQRFPIPETNCRFAALLLGSAFATLSSLSLGYVMTTSNSSKVPYKKQSSMTCISSVSVKRLKGLMAPVMSELQLEGTTISTELSNLNENLMFKDFVTAGWLKQ